MATAEDKAKVFDLLSRGKKDFEAERYDEAKSLYLEALTFVEEKEMKTKWTYELREFIGECEHRLGEFSGAASRNEETLELLDRSDSGQARKSIPRIRYNLARNLEAMSPTFETKEARRARFLKAEQLHVRNTKLGEDECGVEMLQNTRLHLAKIYQELEMFLEAELIYNGLLDDTSTSVNADLQWTIAVRHGHSAALYSLGRHEGSKRGFLKLKEVLRQCLQKDAELEETTARSLQDNIRNVDKYIRNCTDAMKIANTARARHSTDALDQYSGVGSLVRFSRIDTTLDRDRRHDRTSVDPLHKHSEDQRKRKSDTSSETDVRPPKRRKWKGQHVLNRSKGMRRSTSSLPELDRHRSEDLDVFRPQIGHVARPSPLRHSMKDLHEGIGYANSHDTESEAETYGTVDRRDIWFSKLQEYTHEMLYPQLIPYGNKSQRKRVRVAILDSGIDYDRMKSQEGTDFGSWADYLKDNVLQYKDFAGNEDWQETGKDLHGSRCASLVLQTAPQAKLFIANVRKRGRDRIQPQAVAAALAWAISEEVDIVSMSFGWEFVQEQVSLQLNLARDKVLMFAAVSNDGENGPLGGAFPANHQGIFRVHSCDHLGKPSPFTPAASGEISLMLPGEDVAILNKRLQPVQGFDRAKGASCATPIAAGIAALVLDLVRQQVSSESKIKELEGQIKTFAGMTLIFKSMCKNRELHGYSYVKPWQLLGHSEPTEYVNDGQRSHRGHALDQVIFALRERFIKIKGPL